MKKDLEIDHLLSNKDTEVYKIKKTEDGIKLGLHIPGASYRIVELNGNDLIAFNQ